MGINKTVECLYRLTGCIILNSIILNMFLGSPVLVKVSWNDAYWTPKSQDSMAKPFVITMLTFLVILVVPVTIVAFVFVCMKVHEESPPYPRYTAVPVEVRSNTHGSGRTSNTRAYYFPTLPHNSDQEPPKYVLL